MTLLNKDEIEQTSHFIINNISNDNDDEYDDSYLL